MFPSTTWQHRRDRRESQRVTTEPTAGTHWWFIAGVVTGAGTT